MHAMDKYINGLSKLWAIIDVASMLRCPDNYNKHSFPISTRKEEKKKA